MNIAYKKALSEVECILNYLPEDKKNRIPENLIKIIHDKKMKNYTYKFDPNKSYDDLNLSKETEAILAIIYEKFIK